MLPLCVLLALPYPSPSSHLLALFLAVPRIVVCYKYEFSMDIRMLRLSTPVYQG